MAKKLKRTLSILIVNATILCVGLVIVELLFGAWLDPKRLNRLNLIRDRTLHFHVSGLYETPSPVIQYSRDQYGLRGTHGNPGRIDLLTVGGSTTDQRYISDGATWQNVLQKQFSDSGIPITVANAGVDGQSTFGHIKNFDWWFPHVPNLRPKFVLFYVGLNDFHKDVGHWRDRLLLPDRTQTLGAVFWEQSVLCHLWRASRGAYRARVLQVGHRSIDFASIQWIREPLLDDYGFMRPRLDAYAERLRILVARTRDFGSRPVFVSHPSRQYRISASGIEGQAGVTVYDGRQMNGVDHYHMMKRFDDTTEVVCRRMGVPFVDSLTDMHWNDDEFYDFHHMTPAGAKKVGIQLFYRLKDIVGVAEPGVAASK